MALSFTSNIDSVVRHFYKVYMRETGTAIASGDYDSLAHWTSFLALFQHIGYCENKMVKYHKKPNTVPIEFGKKHPISYDQNLEIKFLQNAKADFDAIEDMKDENCDLMYTDDVNHIFWYFHNKRFKVERHITDGNVSFFSIQAQQLKCEASGTYSLLYLRNTIPT